MDKNKDKKPLSTGRAGEIDIRRTKVGENMRVEIKSDKSIKILTSLKQELDEAAKINPCPGCKHDTEQLAKFVSIKLDSVRKGSVMDRGTAKSLKEVDYINELTDIAIGFSKFIKPFTGISKVPEVYEKVLHDDMEANKKVKAHLLKASELIKELGGTDKHFNIVSDVLKAFIRATEFKLGVDPYTFYLFDKTIRLGYKTHILSATSKVIVGIKGIIDPSRYK
jgi:hypothetical protein